MRPSSYAQFWIGMILFTLGLVTQFSPSSFWLQAQSAPPSNVLTPQLLQASGAGHLPSYVTSLPGLIQYQQKLPLHQVLTITWDSLPGQTGPIPKSTADTMTLSGNFTLVTRTRNEPGSPGGTGLDVIQDSLVIVAVTNSGEIRGLKAQGDRRTAHGEALSGGQAEEWVSPKVTLSIVLPDDPLIRNLVFLKPVFSSTGQLSLQKLASMDLWNTTPTGP
jgi:hypothetical protein